jgi:hypothetical protein
MLIGPQMDPMFTGRLNATRMAKAWVKNSDSSLHAKSNVRISFSISSLPQRILWRSHLRIRATSKLDAPIALNFIIPRIDFFLLTFYR